MHFDSTCSCGILILEIRPNFWGGWLKNGGLQEQSSYWGGKLPCSFKKRKGRLNKLRNKPENPSNINLKIFRNNCYVLEPCPEWDLWGSPGWGENLGNWTWNYAYEKAGWHPVGERDSPSCIEPWAVCQLSFSVFVKLLASSHHLPMGLNL